MRKSSTLFRWLIRIGWTALLVVLLRPSLQAQEPSSEPKLDRFSTCPSTASDLYIWEQAYDIGQFELIVDHFACGNELFQATKPSARPGLELLAVTKKFLHLLVLSNLAIGNEGNADSAMIWLLTRFPGYALDPNVDPPQFGQLLDSLIPYAANHFGLFGGANTSLFQVPDPVPLRSDITTGGPMVVGPEFKNRLKFVAGLEWQHHFGFRHSLITGLTANSLSYATYYASRDFGPHPRHRIGDWSITQFDKYSFLQLPVAYQYRIPFARRNKVHQSWLGLQGGLYGQLLLAAGTELLTNKWITENGVDTIPQTDRLTISGPLHRRQFLTSGCTVGVSYQADYRQWSYYVRLAGQWDFQQLRSIGKEYDPDFLGNLWEYHLSDQNFKLHSIRLTIGVLLSKSNRVKT